MICCLMAGSIFLLAMTIPSLAPDRCSRFKYSLSPVSPVARSIWGVSLYITCKDKMLSGA